MAVEQQRLSPVERANLVAYLDGELNEAETRAIATKLTLSMTARREVEILQKTWEMLELLPRPQASPELVSRTLTGVRTLEDRVERHYSSVGDWGRRAVRVALVAGLAAVVFAVGWLATTQLWPDPTARLARDLTLAEHLEEYQAVGSFEFLQELESLPEWDQFTSE